MTLFSIWSIQYCRGDGADASFHPTKVPTKAPTDCDLDKYANRDSLADSKDCDACYNARCKWFDCPDEDEDTASDCYDPNDAEKLATCHRYDTLESCKADYAYDICIPGGIVMIIFGACILVATVCIRYNESQIEESQKLHENIAFLDDDTTILPSRTIDTISEEINDDIGLNKRKNDTKTSLWNIYWNCENESAFWCYVVVLFLSISMTCTGIGLVSAYSILGSHTFDSIRGTTPSLNNH